MKKLLSSALLALAASVFVATDSFAGTFGLFPHCGSCCSCGAKFCVRQYNAFSPVCSGTIFCDGCMPFSSGGGGGGYNGGGYGACAGGMCPGGLNYSGMMSSPMCSDGSCLGSLPATEGAIPDAVSPPAANPVVMPSPLPTQFQSNPTSQTANYRAIQHTSYTPAGYPIYNYAAPAAWQAQPRTMPAPSYWSN